MTSRRRSQYNEETLTDETPAELIADGSIGPKIGRNLGYTFPMGIGGRLDDPLLPEDAAPAQSSSLSFLYATLSLIKTCVGAGALAMPWATLQGGAASVAAPVGHAAKRAHFAQTPLNSSTAFPLLDSPTALRRRRCSCSACGTR